MVVHAYFPLGEPRVQREAAAAAAAFDVTVLCLRTGEEPASEVVDGIAVRRLGVAHVRGAGLGRILFEYLAFGVLAGLWLAARSVRRPFAVVHFHNPPDFLIACGLIPRLRGSRLILDIHDLSSHMFGVRVAGRLGKAVATLLIWVQRLACAVADRVITVHDPYRAELVRQGIPDGKLRVVMNSVDGAVLERARGLQTVHDPSAGFLVAYHGTLTHWYGADLIVDAVALLRAEGRDVQAVILGDGDALPALRARAVNAGIEAHVRFSGRYLPIHEALADVAGADCGVIPNRPIEINRFALSSKLFEYVALGIPVVVARLQTLAGHFDDSEVTFFEPGDAGSLADGIRQIQDDPDRARRKAERAGERAREYSWSVGRDTLMETYREILPAGVA